MNKILVTGATGQIGRFLVRRLTENKENFSGIDIRPPENSPKFELFNIPLNNKIEIKRYAENLKEYDTLIHLASKIDIDPDVMKSGITSIDLNISGTLNLIEFLPNLQHICFTSTYMVYGKPKTNPVKEDHPTEPTTVYGASKLATEKFLEVFSQQRNVSLTILRLMGVYDLEKPHAQAIPSFIQLMANDQKPIIFGDGEIRRNHLHVEDAINAILASIKNRKQGVFNIGGIDSPSNLELVEIINKKMKKAIKPDFQKTEDVQHDFITDISKAQEKLGFKPKITIEEGISKTITRFEHNKW